VSTEPEAIRFHVMALSHCQELWTEFLEESGGALLGCHLLIFLLVFGRSFLQLAVDERRAGADQRDQLVAVDAPPAGLNGFHELEAHRHAGGAAARTLGDPLA
jgi:hypothetical protein